MRIALAQIRSTPDPAANLDLVADGVRAAAAAGARLVVFPEATMCRFGVPLAPVAEPLDGPWATRVRELVASTGLTAVVGMFTPAPDGRVHNTLLVTGAGVETAYAKIHLYDAFGFQESRTVAPGSTPVSVPIDDAVLGLATCYDLRFPGLFQELAGRGADLVVVPSSWGAGPGKAEQWELLVRARALDATAWIAACDQAGAPAGPLDRSDPAAAPDRNSNGAGAAPTGIGLSLVAGPLGTVEQRLGTEPGLLVVDIDLPRVTEARRAVPVLANRRY